MSRFYGTLNAGRSTATKCGHPATGIAATARGWNLGGEVSMRDAAGIDVVDLEVTSGSNGYGHRLHVATLTRNGTGYAIRGGLVADLLAALESMTDNEPCRLDHHGNCQAHRLGNPCEMVAARAAIARARGE